jgi:hypothetical protein
VWHPTVFTKNRDRLLEGEIAEEFFRVVLRQARRKRLLSDEHFTVDGTLIEAWAGQKSFQLKDDDDILKPPPPDAGSNPTINYRKQKRSNDTHQSTTDPLARLYKKSRGSEAKLAYLGHILTENRNGLVVNTRVTLATGTAERDAAIKMTKQIPGGSKRSRWVRIVATTQRTSWSRCRSSESPRMWRRTIPIGGVRSTLGPPVGLGTRLVSENGSVSRKSSGG